MKKFWKWLLSPLDPRDAIIMWIVLLAALTVVWVNLGRATTITYTAVSTLTIGADSTNLPPDSVEFYLVGYNSSQPDSGLNLNSDTVRLQGYLLDQYTRYATFTSSQYGFPHRPYVIAVWFLKNGFRERDNAVQIFSEPVDTTTTNLILASDMKRVAQPLGLVANGGFEAETTLAGTAPIGWVEVADVQNAISVRYNSEFGRTLRLATGGSGDSVSLRSLPFRVPAKGYVHYGFFARDTSTGGSAIGTVSLVRASDNTALQNITTVAQTRRGYTQRYFADSAMSLYIRIRYDGTSDTLWVDNVYANASPQSVDTVLAPFATSVSDADAAKIADSVDADLTIDHGAGLWTGTGGGTGPYVDTIYVFSGVTPLVGVFVTAYNSSGVETGRGLTDVQGKTILSQLAQTLSVYTWVQGYYQNAPIPKPNVVTSSGANDTVLMSTVSTVAPPVAGTTPVQFVFQDGQGNPLRRVQLLYNLEFTGKTPYHKDSTKILGTDTTFVAWSDANGIATAYCVPNDSILIDNRLTGKTRWRFRAASPIQGAWLLGGPDGKALNVPASATALLWPRDQALMGD